MNLQGLVIVTFLSITTLSGCSTTRYLSLKDFPPYSASEDVYAVECPEQTQTHANKICRSRAFANERALYYRDEYIGIQKETSWVFDVPLIGIASGTAATLLFEGSTDLIKGLALGGATWAGYKEYFYNKQNAEYLVKAEKAIRCVNDESRIFITEPLSKEVNWAVDYQKNNLPDAYKLLEENTRLSESPEYKALDATVIVASSAFKQWNSAKKYYDNAPETVVTLVYEIDTKVLEFLKTNTPDVSKIITQIQESTRASVEESTQHTMNEQLTKKADEQTAFFEKAETDDQFKTIAKEYIINLKRASDILISNSQDYNAAEHKMRLCTASL